jgi:signal transduction histidine kinase
MRRFASTIAGIGALTALTILGLVWLDYASTRKELIGLLRDEATALRQTVAAAARSNRAAGAVAEGQLAARLLDTARFLRELERRGPLTDSLMSEVAERSGLFRVSAVSARGEREVGGPTVRQGRGPGPGRGFGGGGGAGLADRLLQGGESEVVSDVHASRGGNGERLAAGVRRDGGGAIIVTVDASAIADLQRPASLHALLDDVTRSADEVAYTVFEAGELRLAHGELPPETSQSPSVPLASERSDERELEVNGRPVIEFYGPVPLADGETAMLRLGMRLDGVRTAERRMLFRLASSLLGATLLVGLSFGTLWWRERYGALSAKHARAEEALRRRDRLAAMGELAASVAHEVRNPLNAIAMSVKRVRREFLATSAESEEERAELAELLGVMEAETQRINRTVQQFLDFARPPRLNPRSIDLAGFVSALVESRRSLAESRGVSLEADVAQAGMAIADSDQLRQAVDNVLRNALEATPSAGTVTVRGHTGGGEHRIEVTDTGPGIDSDKLGRIFDLYYTTKADGTGVGLAVTQQIIAAHGGSIEVESRAGFGTRMTLRWPQAPQEEANA